MYQSLDAIDGYVYFTFQWTPYDSSLDLKEASPENGDGRSSGRDV